MPPADREVWLPGPAGAAVVAATGVASGAAVAAAADVVPGAGVVAAAEVVPGARVVGASDVAPGAPVAVGPRTARPEQVRSAIAALVALVGAGGALAAGADVDLGHEFRSARIDGAPGDRRDALLAALTTAPADLGPPAAILVALFGPAATKRVGAAARSAIDAGAWPVLRFAAAASDVLGPEQLERLLALTAADDTDPFGEGLASDIAGHLARLLGPVSPARRLVLLTSLWQLAGAHQAVLRERKLLRRAQSRTDRSDQLRERYRRFDDDTVLDLVRGLLGDDPSPARIARWVPPGTYWRARAERILQDALAATVLGRLAETASGRGVEEAVRRHRAEIDAVAGFLTKEQARAAARPVPGLTGLPARPAAVIHQIAARPEASIVTPRLARARDWGLVMREVVEDLLWSQDDTSDGPDAAAYREWGAGSMAGWRERVGYFSPDRLAGWELTRPGLPSLAERMGNTPDQAPASVERVDDLLWFGELGDQLARLHGRAAAQIEVRWVRFPEIEFDRAPEPEPLVPLPDSITVATAGAAQLAELGGVVPRRAKTWAELVSGLLGSAAVAAALTEVFQIPAEMAAVDGTTVPGTDLRVEVARSGRQLADWGAYMGNCIGGGYYSEAAYNGECVLVAFRDPEDRIVLNAELLLHARKWRLDEFRARFNADPSPAHVRDIGAWVADLPVPASSPPPLIAPEAPGRVSRRRNPAAQLLRETGPVLSGLLDGVPPPEALVALAHMLPAAPHTRGPEAVNALRRAAPATVLDVCRRALAGPDGPDLREIWAATGDRPLARAVAELGMDTLRPLTLDEPLPGRLRPLSHLSEVTTARTIDLVALRVRVALGRLLRADDPDLAQAVRERPAVADAECDESGRHLMGLARRGAGRAGRRAGARLSVHCAHWRAVDHRAPRTPRSSGPSPATPVCVVPFSWLAAGGWPALWSRAARAGH